MSIGKIVGSIVNVAKKYPIATTAGVGVAGIIGYKAATTSRKQAVDTLNWFYLSNPYTNPLGCWQHMFDWAHKNNTPKALDGPIANYIVNQNNKSYQDYYNNLSDFERVQEFYRNGGKGVQFNATA